MRSIQVRMALRHLEFRVESLELTWLPWPHSPWRCFLIGFPLGDMELFLGELRVAHELAADIVEALDGAYGGGAYGCATAVVGE